MADAHVAAVAYSMTVRGSHIGTTVRSVKAENGQVHCGNDVRLIHLLITTTRFLMTIKFFKIILHQPLSTNRTMAHRI